MQTQSSPRAIGPLEFSRLGEGEVVYIRTLKNEQGLTRYALYSVDGTRLAIDDSYAEAVLTARYNGLMPETVH
jgi:hypothetical protein